MKANSAASPGEAQGEVPPPTGGPTGTESKGTAGFTEQPSKGTGDGTFAVDPMEAANKDQAEQLMGAMTSGRQTVQKNAR